MRPIYRSLVVGLGRWGRQVVEQTWLGLRSHTEDSQSDIPYVAALVIDAAVDSSDTTPKELLPTDSYLLLSSKGMQAYLQSLVNDPAEMLKDIPEDADPAKYETGSDTDIKNKRLGAAMVIRRRQKQVENVFDLHLSRLVDDHEWAKAKERGYQPALDNAVTVYLVAALDEVTGGGFLPAILELLPALEFFKDQSRRLNLVGVFTAFDALNNPLASANTYATIVELNGILYEWLNERQNTRELVAAGQTCYLVESVNEKGEPIGTEEREKLVVQFLTSSITRPIPFSLIKDGPVYKTEELPNKQQRRIPLYDSFIQVEYVLPTEQIKAYLCYCVGKNLVSSSGLLQEIQDQKAVEVLVSQFKDTELRLGTDTLIGDANNKIYDETIFLNRNDQQKILFLLPTLHEIIKASRLYQSVDVVRSKQKEFQNFFQAYQETLNLHILNRMIPSFQSKVSRLINGVVVSNLDGLERSSYAAQNLAGILSQWHKKISESVDKEGQAKRAQRAESVGKEYKALVTDLVKPLATFARSSLTFIINAIVWIIVFAALVPDTIGESFWANLAVKFAHAAVVFITPFAWFIPVLILLFSIEYSLENNIIGRLNKEQSGYSIPGALNLGFAAIWPTLVSGIALYFLYSQAADGASGSLNLLPENFFQTLVIGAGVTGVVSALLYGWFYYRQITDIKNKLVAWVNAIEETANYDYYLLRYRTVETIYLELIKHCENEQKRVAEYKQGLQQMREFLDKQQSDLLLQMQDSTYRFRKLAAAGKDRLEAIFERDLALKPDIQSVSFITSLGEGEYLRWLELPREEKSRAITQFALGKTAGIFDGKNLVTFLAPDAKGDDVELRKLLLPQLSFVRDYSPQWSLYSQKGELQVFAGVGDEDDVALRDALKSIGAVAFQSKPNVYETGDAFSLVLTIIRRGRMLAELEELQNYKKEYFKFKPWQVHTRRANQPDPLPNVSEPVKPVREPKISQVSPSEAAAVETPEQVMEQLGIAANAGPAEIENRFETLLKELGEARDGLMDRFSRYQHFSGIERGEVKPPNWFQLLGLEINRNVTADEITAAYARKKKQLEDGLALLTAQKEAKQEEGLAK